MTQGYTRSLSRSEVEWLEALEAVAAAGKLAVAPLAGTPAGRTVLGRGGGGDITLALDGVTEDTMLAVLARSAPGPYSVVSEEVGVVTGPVGAVKVIVDPVDGSLNAKHGLAPYCAALAVAYGETMDDVAIAYTADYTREVSFAAVRGAGVVRRPAAPSAAVSAGGASTGPAQGAEVEVVLLEAGRPHGYSFGYADLARLAGEGAGSEMRVRQIGSLALSLGYLAAGIADVLFAPVASRSVDVAGGLLMVWESGGDAAALDQTETRRQPLDLERRAPFVAWRAGLDGERIEAAARAILGGRSG
ncbi:MAG: hypothetical protein KKA32_01205 [Actinobacteria bacterium]|nr:hypothetical protein [Actinomycetota bacterium]